jgi:hypothetical protein
MFFFHLDHVGFEGFTKDGRFMLEFYRRRRSLLSQNRLIQKVSGRKYTINA